MSFLNKIFSTGVKDLVGGIGDVVDKFVTTKEEKALLKLELNKVTHQHEISLRELAIEEEKIANERESELNDRIKSLEGTASDLKQFGWIGSVVVFLRGLQRPVWGFGTIYMDFMVFSGKWKIPDDDQLKSAFWIINLIVLVFLFGERAIKNVAPLIKEFFDKTK